MIALVTRFNHVIGTPHSEWDYGRLGVGMLLLKLNIMQAMIKYLTYWFLYASLCKHW